MPPSDFPAPRFTVPSGNVRLAVYGWGRTAKARPVVLLIHGYPDSARVWQATAERLAESFTVYAYDVRGAGTSSRPRRVSDYRLDRLQSDLVAVMSAISPDAPVHLVGHDWGSIQTWESVTDPALRERIASFTTLSGPCLDHAGHWLRARMRGGTRGWGELAQQFGHSWYVMLFQLPLLAPAMWSLAIGRRWPDILHRLEGIDAESSPTQTADGRWGVNLYRANFPQRLMAPRARHTTVPIQLISATSDPFMVRGINDDLEQWAPNLTRCDIDAGHWLPLTAPEYLADCIQTFIHDQAPPPTARRKRGA